VVSSVKSTGNFQALADEKIVIPPVTREEAAAPALPSLQEQQALKEAFAAVNQVIAKQDFTPLSQVEKVENITGAYEPPKESKPREFEPKESKPREFEAKESKPRVSASKEHKPRELEPKESKPREAVIKKSEPREMPHREVVPESLGKGAARESFSEEQQTFFKMVYKVLMEQEVSEIYINQLLDDMERASKSTDGLQFLIANTYQKMILKLGKLQPIVLAKKRPKVVFFIGPTGVGKTTTIAKIASKFKLEQEKKVALLTADTYRIAAAEQLRTYANILDIPLSVVYTPEDIGREVEAVADCDLILVDTAGFSHKNDSQREDMQTLLESLPEEYERDIYLVLSATTKYKDLVEITDSYQAYCRFALIFTKLDETGAYGNIYNIRMHTQAPLSYITTGQNVPDDMEEVDTQKLVKQLLGGK
jgi:flagellar biosynthesis protein FlhF